MRRVVVRTVTRQRDGAATHGAALNPSNHFSPPFLGDIPEERRDAGSYPLTPVQSVLDRET
jgi:hypothetical protein